MGIGDPLAKDKPTAAFGDIGSLIIDNLPYGSLNIYKSNTPKNAPLTGEPSPQLKKNLIQRSSTKFSQFDLKDKSEGYIKGKTCLGISS